MKKIKMREYIMNMKGCNLEKLYETLDGGRTAIVRSVANVFDIGDLELFKLENRLIMLYGNDIVLIAEETIPDYCYVVEELSILSTCKNKIEKSLELMKEFLRQAEEEGFVIIGLNIIGSENPDLIMYIYNQCLMCLGTVRVDTQNDSELFNIEAYSNKTGVDEYIEKSVLTIAQKIVNVNLEAKRAGVL